MIKISVSDDNMFLAQTLQEGVLVVGVEAVVGPDVLVVGSTQVSLDITTVCPDIVEPLLEVLTMAESPSGNIELFIVT